MSGISYTPPGGGTGLMTTFSGTFTTADLNGGANSPVVPGDLTHVCFNMTANPLWPANAPRMFLVMDTAIANQTEITLPMYGDPFNLNWIPVDSSFTPLWYTQSYASSFLNISPGAGGLVGTVINYTALCWQP